MCHTIPILLGVLRKNAGVILRTNSRLARITHIATSKPHVVHQYPRRSRTTVRTTVRAYIKMSINHKINIAYSSRSTRLIFFYFLGGWALKLASVNRGSLSTVDGRSLTGNFFFDEVSFNFNASLFRFPFSFFHFLLDKGQQFFKCYHL